MSGARMSRPVAALLLLGRFLLAVVVSGAQTALVILRASAGGDHAPKSAFVRLRYAPMDERGASLLGGMITLTPGTTTIDIDPERREMLLHVLDASDLDGLLAAIRRDFERYLVVLFGREGPR
ncbi:MAG: Na+/H+ antiporter subunit E [Steroidobacteraceae bacterium]|jgi:multisubunit Na+/H+ antiporter MnhE subunit|nr:Na+/H+ antiporter subunit E [Steroidobacteraceae bacterium]